MKTGKSGRPAYPDGYRKTEKPIGYVRIKLGGQWLWEHRVVMEQKIGRPIADGERVFHINGNKADNRPENLRLAYRGRKRAFTCPHCGKETPPGDC